MPMSSSKFNSAFRTRRNLLKLGLLIGAVSIVVTVLIVMQKPASVKEGSTSTLFNQGEKSSVSLEFNTGTGNAVNIPVKGTLNPVINAADLARIPDSISVYQMLPVVNNEQDFRSYAQRFGISGVIQRNVIKTGEMSVSYITPLNTLEYRNDAHESSNGIQGVPGIQAARRLAWEFAQEKRLLSPSATIIASNQRFEVSPRTNNKTMVVNRDVVIGRSIEGYDVRGPGMQLRITLGNKGKVLRATNSLRPLKLYKRYKIKPLEQALKEAQIGQNTMNLQPEIESPKVTNVSIFYYAQYDSCTLIPVYAFMSGECCIYVPACGEQL